MNAIERRRYEMLLKVREFGNTHRQVFSTLAAAQKTFEAVSAAIDELTATDMMKMAASTSARGNRKAAARKALTELLQRVSQLARMLRAGGMNIPAFELPPSKSDQALLTAGRRFAHDAVEVDEELTAHGMGPTVIAAATAAFAAAARDRGMTRADHIKARLRIRELLATALRGVRRLDLMVANEVPNDPVVQGLWKQASHVDEARGDRPRGDSAEPETPAAAEAADTSVAATPPKDTSTPQAA